MTHVTKLITLAVAATGILACANGDLIERESPTEVGQPTHRSDAQDGDIARFDDAGDDVRPTRDSGPTDTGPDLPPWEEGTSCFPSDPFVNPVIPQDLGSGPAGGEVTVVQTRSGLLVVRAGVSTEDWGVYVAKTDREATTIASQDRIPSLYPVRDPVAVKVPGGFLVAYTQVAEDMNSVLVARLSDDGDLAGEPVLVGEDYVTSPGDTFVDVEGQAILFVLDEQSGQPSYRQITVSNAGVVTSDESLELGEGARDLAVAVTSDQLGLSWVSGASGARTIQFAALSKDGSSDVAPTQVAAEGASRPTSIHSTGSGWAVVYGTSVDEAVFKVWMLQLDANGVPVAPPRELSAGSSTAVFPRAAWDGEVLAVVWQENSSGDIVFSLVGLDGTTTGPSTVSVTEQGGLLPNVFWVGDRYAVTWQDWSNDTGYIQRVALSAACE